MINKVKFGKYIAGFGSIDWFRKDSNGVCASNHFLQASSLSMAPFSRAGDLPRIAPGTRCTLPSTLAHGRPFLPLKKGFAPGCPRQRTVVTKDRLPATCVIWES